MPKQIHLLDLKSTIVRLRKVDARQALERGDIVEEWRQEYKYAYGATGAIEVMYRVVEGRAELPTRR